MTETEIIVGLQAHKRKVENEFYERMHSYFHIHFRQIFFDEDSKNEVFQRAFIKLWTEIENKTIKVIDGEVCRRRSSGEYLVMTASLTTFMMTFAKNEYRELLRDVKEDNYAEVFDPEDAHFISEEENEEEEMARLIDEGILEMSPQCREILTMFYYRHLSLDEIMEERGEKNGSKNGLKTAKNKCLNKLKEKVTAAWVTSGGILP